MNKKELLEALRDSDGYYDFNPMPEKYKEAMDDAIALVKELEEPEKAVVPKWFDKWLNKDVDSMSASLYALSDVYENLNYTFWNLTKEQDEYITGNFPELADAIVNGYKVEKEPRWVVSFNDEGKYYFSNFKGNSLLPVGYKPWSDSRVFTDKQKAEAIALLIDGEVEEVKV